MRTFPAKFRSSIEFSARGSARELPSVERSRLGELLTAPAESIKRASLRNIANDDRETETLAISRTKFSPRSFGRPDEVSRGRSGDPKSPIAGDKWTIT